MNDIQQAKEWADTKPKRLMADDTLAAVEVIQSLPDQIVDGSRLRQIIDFQGTGISDDARKDLEALLTPPLRTLADMTPEEREACQWMQAQVFPTASTLGIITGVDEYAHSAIILFADGMAKNVPWGHITPLPGPKLEWPSLFVSDKSEAVSVATEDVTEESRTALPRPEDVPDPHPGEAWLVNTREGEQREALKAGNRWYVKDGDDVEEWIEEALTPIARLVPAKMEAAKEWAGHVVE